MAMTHLRQLDDDQVLQWAEQFVEEMAQGKHDHLPNLESLTEEQQVALAQFVEGAMEHEESAIRCTGAWIVSQIDVMPECATELLCRLLHDAVDEVRREAAWALSRMPYEAVAAVDDLIELLNDPDDGVKLAALEALAEIGKPAKAAVPRLLKLAHAKSNVLRGFATKALARIAPTVLEAQSLFVESISTAGTGNMSFATFGLGSAKATSAQAVPLIAANLESPDSELVLISGWALGQIGSAPFDAMPALLSALSRHQWMQIGASEVGGERIDVRPDLIDSLHWLLPDTNDGEYDDFRRLFLHHAFHPDSVADKKWVADVIEHPWYLKLQRARFPHPNSRGEAQERRSAIEDAKRKFFNRLLGNATLGLTPGQYELLPGFLKNHTRNIAWSITRSRQRANRRISNLDVSFAGGERPLHDEVEFADTMAEFWHFIQSELPKELSTIFRLRNSHRWTIPKIADYTGLSPSQVKTRLKHAQGAAERWLKDHH